mgnify:CR=1 FL=1
MRYKIDRNHKITRFLCLLLGMILLTGSMCIPVYAAEYWPEGPEVVSPNVIVMEASTGTVLYDRDSLEAHYPASITKILTALIVIENCGLDETVTFSNTAVNSLEPNSSILGARAGDTLSVRDCLYALLLQSANEVANALAEHCAGSIDAFAEKMNEKAAELGCTDSHFANPSGLNDPNHYVSAYDMALIAKAAFNNPTFVEVDSTTYYDVPAGKLKQYPDGWRYYAHHRMLRRNDSLYYDGAIGGKTGYTEAAGNTLVTYAKNDNTYLVSVVLQSVNGAYSDTKALLDYGFNNFSRTAVKDLPSKITRHLLPAEKYILKDYKDDMLFETRRTASVSLPSGVDSNALEKTYSITKNPADAFKGVRRICFYSASTA